MPRNRRLKLEPRHSYPFPLPRKPVLQPITLYLVESVSVPSIERAPKVNPMTAAVWTISANDMQDDDVVWLHVERRAHQGFSVLALHRSWWTQMICLRRKIWRNHILTRWKVMIPVVNLCICIPFVCNMLVGQVVVERQQEERKRHAKTGLYLTDGKNDVIKLISGLCHCAFLAAHVVSRKSWLKKEEKERGRHKQSLNLQRPHVEMYSSNQSYQNTWYTDVLFCSSL